MQQYDINEPRESGHQVAAARYRLLGILLLAIILFIFVWWFLTGPFGVK